MSVTLYPHLKWQLKIPTEKDFYKLITKVEQYFNLNITLLSKNYFIKNDSEYIICNVVEPQKKQQIRTFL
jgi:hypothetical protein